MFSRKPKTVAKVMMSFQTIIDDLEAIAEQNIDLSVELEKQSAIIQAKIETADLEIHQANGVVDRLNVLVYGGTEELKTNKSDE